MKKIITLIIFLFLAACNFENKPVAQVYSGNALGTSFQVQFFHEEQLQLERQLDSTFQVLNQSLSTYIPSSAISKINDGDTNIVVDQQFIDNFQASKQIHRITDGYFDPTVGILVNAYGFGPKKYDLEIDQNTIDSLMKFVGMDKVSLSLDNTIKKEHPSIFLDFNSIAKGYAVDRVAALLDAIQVEDYLVEIGGELVGKGINKRYNQAWRVGIDNPNAEPSAERELMQFVVNLQDLAMATSGNYRKFKTDSIGDKFVHTINPKTGKNEATDVLSASVFAKNCMLADAYATAFMAMGIEKSMRLLPELDGIDAILIYAEKADIKTHISDGIQDYIEEID